MMEPRSIYQGCPEHGSGCVAIVHLEPGVRSMHGAPAWVERWQQHYPGMGVVAVEHVKPEMPPPTVVTTLGGGVLHWGVSDFSDPSPEPEPEKKRRRWRRK